MIRAGGKTAAGFTLLELAVAMTVLTGGGAVLWYGVRSSARLDRLNRIHHAAFLAAESEMESLRLTAKGDIHDTDYVVSGPGGVSMRLKREVFDSARIVNTLPELVLDENLAPVECRKPLEVAVRVDLESDLVGAGESASGNEGSGNPSSRILIRLTAKLPEYRWY